MDVVSGAQRFDDVRWLASVGSTNAEVMALANEGAPEGLVIVADHQAAGRGRLGRSWVEPPGAGLLVSVLMRPLLQPEQVHLATAVVALAAADACRDVAQVQAALKWPNDLLLGGAKLAGVLAETCAGAIVVGIGINVNWPTGAELPAGATSLNRHTGADVDRGALLSAMLESLETRRACLDEPSPRAVQASEYRRRCATIGEQVRVTLADETLAGVATDLTPEGHLLVEVGTCIRRVSAGDVVHLRTQPRNSDSRFGA